jgi:hypothetical protein
MIYFLNMPVFQLTDEIVSSRCKCLAPNAEKITDKKHLEKHQSGQCRTAVAGAIEPLDSIPYELEVKRSLNFASKITARDLVGSLKKRAALPGGP